MPSPVLEASQVTVQPAASPVVVAPWVCDGLPEVEQGLAQLSAPSRGWVARLLGGVTGSVNRDGLQARYEAWKQARAVGDLTAQIRTLGDLRAAFERFQDHCSVDDHIVAQRVYAHIDAVLERLRAQLPREAG